jgi:DNA-binding transcriptional ArsR family regulator
MSPDREPSRVQLGSAQLRVLAHPVRSRLLSALRAHGPATATALAGHLQTNTGASSYHLRQLAEVGLIEEDRDRGSARERWWRAAHEYTSWQEHSFEADPDDRAAADWLLGHHVRLTSRWVEDWVESRREWPLAWRRAADQSDYEFHLTPEGLEALNRELTEVIGRHRARADPDEAGAERCAVIVSTFPMPAPRL